MNSQNNISLLRIALAQINTLVGDIESNTDKLIKTANTAIQEFNADLVVFTELTLCSYPPEDLLYRQGMYRRIEEAIEKIRQNIKKSTVVFGYPQKTEHGLCNMAAIIQDGDLIAEYAKQQLPNYGVFDEKRYFIPGSLPCVFSINGFTVGVSICEDAWHSKTMTNIADSGAELILNLNASPYHAGKVQVREQVISDRVLETKIPLVYVNQVGGQDELVFDGGSFVMNADCTIAYRCADFEEDLACLEFKQTDYGLQTQAIEKINYLSDLESVYKALVLGVKDYVHKNGFKGAVIGLSGGIDSALTLAIAVDALGAENVMAVSMPSKHTAEMSINDAKTQADLMAVEFELVEINSIFDSFLTNLKPLFKDKEEDTTEENIQARIRGVILMALSNKFGRIVLTTGNKSEVAVGYCTLYGDMVGGYSVLKDVPKMLVYRLAHFRNTQAQVIPQRVIDRPPSAELAPDQKDEDSLPPYDILDPIIELYVEQDKCFDDIVAKGYQPEVVTRIIKLINQNEYKRRQAAPGVRISERAFGRDRRYPITSGFVR